MSAPSRKRGAAGSGGWDGKKVPRTAPARPSLTKKEIDALGKKLRDVVFLNGQAAEAKRLIAAGAPVDWKDSDGKAPLHHATSRGYRMETVMLLLENRCDINITDNDGNTPLHLAVHWDNVLVARLLVWSLCDLKICNAEGKIAAEMTEERASYALGEYVTNEAPLEQANIRANPSFREALREKYQPQAERERQAWLGELLLRACSRYRGLADAKRLIAEGAPVDYQPSGGWAPLHCASIGGHTDMMELLIENKCDINVRDQINGDTPLFVAAGASEPHAVGVLVEAGCDVTIRGFRNKTPAEEAKESIYSGLADYIDNHRFIPAEWTRVGWTRVQGSALRAMQRDLLETGLLPAGPLSAVIQLATGWDMVESAQFMREEIRNEQ